MSTQEKVILVNENDQPIGLMDKMEAHEKGLLHRAFSVFVFNDNDELLIHRRALTKYHSSGLWTNTCCSHPRENESVLEAAHRRLKEEMGFDCELSPIFSFIYRANLDSNLIENELDHVLIGTYNAPPVPNPEEVNDWQYVALDDLVADIHHKPNDYTVWFKIALPKVLKAKASVQ